MPLIVIPVLDLNATTITFPLFPLIDYCDWSVMWRPRVLLCIDYSPSCFRTSACVVTCPTGAAINNLAATDAVDSVPLLRANTLAGTLLLRRY